MVACVPSWFGNNWVNHITPEKNTMLKQLVLCVTSGVIGALVALSLSHGKADAGAQVAECIRAKSFEVVDDTGHTVAHLALINGRPELYLWGKSGSVTTVVDEHGGRTILTCKQGDIDLGGLKDRVAIGISPREEKLLSTDLMLSCSPGDASIVAHGKMASVLLADEKTHPRAWLRYWNDDPDQTAKVKCASLDLYNGKDKLIWQSTR
jgi:hypothetical protein